MRPKFSIDAKREFAAQMRKKPTLAERALWYRLRNKQTGFIFRRQHYKRGYILDFYCSRVKLCIEVDGSIHDLPGHADADAKKEQVLTESGIKVLRFTNQDVLDFSSVVMARIETTLKALSLCTVGDRTPSRPSSSSSQAENLTDTAQVNEDARALSKLKAVLSLPENLCRPTEIPEDQRLTRASVEQIVAACKKLIVCDRQRTMVFDTRTSAERAFDQKYRLQEWLKKHPRPAPQTDEAAMTLQGMHVTERKA